MSSDDCEWITSLGSGGYPREWFVECPDLELLQCCLCLDVVRSPLNMGGCSHLVCQSCIQEYWAKHARNQEKSCPTCRSVSTIGAHPDKSLLINRFAESLVHRLAMKCPATACEWTGTMGVDFRNLRDHYQRCKLAPVPCPHLGCMQKLPRDVLSTHEDVECGWRRVKCTCCELEMTLDQLGSIQHAGSHAPEHFLSGRNDTPDILCKLMARCMADGCGRNLPSVQLVWHQAHECTGRLVRCLICSAPNEHMVPYFRLQEHLASFPSEHLAARWMQLEMHGVAFAPAVDKPVANNPFAHVSVASVGHVYDVKDKQGTWYQAKVVSSDRVGVLVHFINWDAKWNEKIRLQDVQTRFATRGTHTTGPYQPSQPSFPASFPASFSASFSASFPASRIPSRYGPSLRRTDNDLYLLRDLLNPLHIIPAG